MNEISDHLQLAAYALLFHVTGGDSDTSSALAPELALRLCNKADAEPDECMRMAEDLVWEERGQRD